mgnify:CR=1 FL=1
MALKVGDKAPEFKLKDSFEKEVSLSDFKGKRIILYFYPKDNTPGCTKQLCALRDDFSKFKKEDTIIFGINHADYVSHQKFINNYNVESRYSGLETYWCYLHYGAFAKNQTLKGFTLFFYRILRLGKHNGFKHIINLPILNRKLYWICRRIYLKLNYKKYVRERMKHAWQ